MQTNRNVPFSSIIPFSRLLFFGLLFSHGPIFFFLSGILFEKTKYNKKKTILTIVVSIIRLVRNNNKKYENPTISRVYRNYIFEAVRNVRFLFVSPFSCLPPPNHITNRNASHDANMHFRLLFLLIYSVRFSFYLISPPIV